MDQKRYKIIFNGGSVPSHDVERVKNNLANLFKTEPSRLDVLFQDQLVVLKKNLPLDQADAYRDTVERVGGYCIIEAMDESARVSVLNLTTRQEKMVCPKCRSVQPKNPVCSACGVLVADYRQRIAENQAAVMEAMQEASAASTGASVDSQVASQPDSTQFDTDPLPGSN